MKSHTEYLTFNLPTRMAFENITPRIEAIVKASGIQEGLVLCNTKHIAPHNQFSGLSVEREETKKPHQGLATLWGKYNTHPPDQRRNVCRPP